MSKTKAIIFDLDEILSALPGSIDLIHRVRELGLKTALVTSKDNIEMMEKLEAAGLINYEMRSEQVGLAAAIEAAARNKVFDAMVNSLDVQEQKPYPDIFWEAAVRLEEAPAACCVIDNSPDGMEAAKAAGMRCIDKELSAIQAEDLL